MARLSRIFQKIFASSASNNGVFGSAQDGTKVLTNNLTTLQSKPAFLTGWVDAIIGSSKFPPLEEFQSLNYINTAQLAYLFQEGVPEWENNTTYFTNSWAKKPASNQLYASIVDNNIGNALTDATKWKLLFDFDVQRKSLTANTTYYIATTGNDTTGAGTVGNPWKTLQKAWNYLQANIDFAGFTVTIQIADGTYTEAFVASGIMPGQATPGNLIINGNSTTPANVLVTSATQSAIDAVGAKFRIQYMKLTTTGGGNNCLTAESGSVIELGGGIQFGACVSGHIDVGSHSIVSVGAEYTINGNAAYHILVPDGGLLVTGSFTHTLTGTPAFSQQFVNAALGGEVNASNTTYSGAATGTRFLSQNGGMINTNGGGANFFPGNAAGSGTNFSASPYGLYL